MFEYLNYLYSDTGPTTTTYGLTLMCSNLSRPLELICRSGVSVDNTSSRKGSDSRTLVAVPGNASVNPVVSLDNVSNL